MPLLLRIELITTAIVFFSIVVNAVRKNRLLLKYALIWLFMALFFIIISILPNRWIAGFTNLLGIETPSNAVFLIVNVFEIIIIFLNTIIISKQSEMIRNTTQAIAIIENKVKKLEEQKGEVE